MQASSGKERSKRTTTGRTLIRRKWKSNASDENLQSFTQDYNREIKEYREETSNMTKGKTTITVFLAEEE